MKLVLGAAQFGLPYGITNYNKSMPDDSELEAILDYALSNGIQTIDTAEAYGEANTRIKKYHRRSSHKFHIINKILRFSLESKSQLHFLKESLKRDKEELDIPTFDCIMLHHAPSLNHFIDQDFFQYLKEENICKKIGLSIHNESDYFEINTKLSVDIVQAPFNILNQNTLNQSFIHQLKEKNCDIHVRSIFLQGLLLAGLSKIPDHLTMLLPYIKRLEDLSKKTGESLQTICFSFVLYHENIDKIVIGVQSKDELAELFESYHKALELKKNGTFLIEWDTYSCQNSFLVDPTQWGKN
jgi:aryl-alcohol dehydrogenase-like predicted oxidoreductase